MGECNPLSTPGGGAESSLEQPEENLLNEVGKQRFQAITGSVTYLTQVIRYNCMYTVIQLARGMSKPSKSCLAALKRLLRHPAGTTNFSVVYKNGGFNLKAYSNANWGNNPVTAGRCHRT